MPHILVMSYRWARSWLWFWAALMFVGTPLARAAPKVSSRMAVVLSGPMKLILQAQQELTLPLSAEAEIVQTSAYRKAAAAIGIRHHPRSNRAAPFVGRALGAQFVLLIDAIEVPGPGGPQDFVGVRLIDTASSVVLHEQRYFLPTGTLTPSVAAAMLERLVPLVRSQSPSIAQEAAPPAVPRTRPTLLPPTPMPQSTTARRPGRIEPPAPRAVARAAAQTPHRNNALEVGPRIVWRRARLKPMLPLGSAGAIPYGAGHGLGQSLLGGGAALALHWRRLGLNSRIEWVTGKHNTLVSGVNETGRASVLQVASSLAVELLGHFEARVAPRLGMRYDRLPIDVGPFVGLSYLAGTVGLQLATPKFRNCLQLHGTVDGIFLARLGLEAARAGRPHLAQGVTVSLQPRVFMGAWYGSLAVTFDHRAAHFTGATALFSHARYQAMALSDTHLSVGIDLGGSF